MTPVYIIGDVHGQYAKLVTLLTNASLIDSDLHWAGADAQLWFLGDFVDRGPDGIGVIELVMRLQNEAARVGGLVQSVIGNHDLMLLAAYRFGRAKKVLANLPDRPEDFPIDSVDMFTAEWLHMGGVPRDLVRMTGKHAAWLSHLPAMARVDDHLLIHADALLYVRSGSTLDEVNQLFREALDDDDYDQWSTIIDGFSEHRAFMTTGGTQRAMRLLRIFECARIVHGHTPIQKITDEHPSSAVVYANGRCINVDGGMYLGGDGFIYSLD